MKSFEDIQRIVAKSYNITVEQMRSKSRVSPIPESRHVSWFLFRIANPDVSILRLSKIINVPDTKICRAVKQCEFESGVYEVFGSRIEKLKNECIKKELQ